MIQAGGATAAALTTAATTSAAAPAARLRSLDALRGIAIAAMILVNNPGDAAQTYPALEHADWNGLAAADFIFPFFLFVVGAAVSLSLRGRGLGMALWRRTFLLLALGIFLNGFPLFDWSSLRLPGVLQRIALCSLLASIAASRLSTRALASLWAALIAGYWVVLTLASGDAAFAREGNAAAFVDEALLRGHLLHEHWDPEGLLGTLPALATTLTGLLAGNWLRSRRRVGVRIGGLLGAGAAGMVLGLALDAWCPINKNLWTSSYVLLTGGAAACALAACYWLIDVRGRQTWALPFVAYGTNPIAVYVLSSLIAKDLLLWHVARPGGGEVDLQRRFFEAAFLPLASPAGASALYAATYVLLWLGVAAFLYRRNVFIKV